MSCAASIGTGSVWMERCPKLRRAGNKAELSPTDRGKGGVKRRLLTEGHGVPKSDRTIWRFSILPVA